MDAIFLPHQVLSSGCRLTKLTQVQQGGGRAASPLVSCESEGVGWPAQQAFISVLCLLSHKAAVCMDRAILVRNPSPTVPETEGVWPWSPLLDLAGSGGFLLTDSRK